MKRWNFKSNWTNLFKYMKVNKIKNNLKNKFKNKLKIELKIKLKISFKIIL